MVFTESNMHFTVFSLLQVVHDIILDCSFHQSHQMAEKARSMWKQGRHCTSNQISEGFIPIIMQYKGDFHRSLILLAANVSA